MLAEARDQAWGTIPDCLVKYTLQVALRERRTLEVLLCLDLLCDHDGLLVLNGRHLLLSERLLGRLVVPQVEFCANEDDGYTRRVMIYLWVPLASVSVRLSSRGRMRLYLCLYVIERWRANNGKADEEDIGLGVRKRSQPVVILLSSSIPQSQAYWLSVYHDICGVVIEARRVNSSFLGERRHVHCRDVLAGEGVGCV